MIRLALLGCVLLITTTFAGQEDGVNLRAELAKIDYRHARNMDDYIARCQRVRKLLPRLDIFYVEAGKTIYRLMNAHRDDANYQRLATFYSHLNAEDQKALRLLRQEMILASEIPSLPENQRKAFFKAKVLPKQNEEDQIGKEEVRMAAEAKKNGLPLPPDVSQALP